MDSYERRTHALQAKAMADLQKEFARAGAEAKTTKGTLRGERQLVALQFSRARLQQGMSQAELGRRTGIPQPVISRIESGKANPNLTTLLKLAKALGVNLMVE